MRCRFGWDDNHELVDGAAERLRAGPKLEKTLYFAVSSDGIGDITDEFSRTLAANASAGLHWHYEPMPEEKHSTIYHPAALRAFRAVFKPPVH